ncbi:MAG: PmoA family protein [Sedimentisphaerales bacterium]|nr:PmoA family protein [Sedimentisphaerales bacterium]
MRNRKLITFCLTVFFILFLFLTAQCHSELSDAAEPLARITVEAGEYTRTDTPVSVELDGINYKQLRLEEVKDSQLLPVPIQIEAGNPPKLWWVLSGITNAEEKRFYNLSEGSPARTEGVKVIKEDSFLQIQIGNRKVLRYNNAVVPPPEGADSRFARSGFIHPLWSPAGEVLTRIHPKDHIHHLGLWGPWTKTEFEGRDVDFWNLGDGKGTVRFAKFISTESGDIYGGFRAMQEHIDLKAPEGEKAALNEELDVRVWNSDRPNEGWLLDYTTKQSCASASSLRLLAYRYGGLGFRATGQWTESNSDYLTSEGKTRKDGHGTRARWCDVFGLTEKGPAGVLFMSYVNNHEHPEPMRIWPEGDVFFNFCPIQQADWMLELGKTYVLRYRLYVHSGKITAETAERLWQDFSYPPKVKLEKLK